MRNIPIFFIFEKSRFLQHVAHATLKFGKGIFFPDFRDKNKKEAVFYEGKVTSECFPQKTFDPVSLHAGTVFFSHGISYFFRIGGKVNQRKIVRKHSRSFFKNLVKVLTSF